MGSVAAGQQQIVWMTGTGTIDTIREMKRSEVGWKKQIGALK
jgi:hypothetical protein